MVLLCKQEMNFKYFWLPGLKFSPIIINSICLLLLRLYNYRHMILTVIFAAGCSRPVILELDMSGERVWPGVWWTVSLLAPHYSLYCTSLGNLLLVPWPRSLAPWARLKHIMLGLDTMSINQTDNCDVTPSRF